MTDELVKQTIKDIKQSFRLLMNGVTAQSMREKGIDQHLNWGASVIHLGEMAAEYTPDYKLAQALWKENVRECKILATMLMPHDKFPEDLALLWIEQTSSLEIAEQAAMNLYQYMPYATDLSMALIARTEPLMQIQGLSILSRLCRKSEWQPDTRLISEMLDQIVCALKEDNVAVKHAAWNAIQHFAERDEMCYLAAKNALKMTEMDDWL